MKKIWLLAFAAMVSLTAFAQENVGPYPSFVQVQGTAEREIVPDEIYLSITINERDSKGKITVEQQQRDMLTALRRQGIDVDKQLKMVDLTSSYFKKRTAVATAQYQLKLGSSAEVAKAWQALDALGISQVNVEKVSHSQLAQYKAEVRTEAMRAARENARSLAEAIGQRIGKCFYIYDSNSGIMPKFYAANTMMRAAGMMDAAEAAVEDKEAFEFRTLKLQYHEQAKFVLE